MKTEDEKKKDEEIDEEDIEGNKTLTMEEFR